MTTWLRHNALLLALSALAILAWLVYLVIALSETSPAWVPEILRLPNGESGTSVLSRRGQFGDAFGAFNALVSTLALIGLLFTLRAQQEQIRNQERTSASNDNLIRQQQFQEQLFRAVDAYREQLQAVTGPGSTSGSGQVVGRLALQSIWRDQFVRHIKSTGTEQLRTALLAQREAYSNELSGIWNSHDNVFDESARLIAFLESDGEARSSVLRRFGSAWRVTHLANRYQLDSLYRAWYTVYRILDTAPAYRISPDVIRLYSASFRAQISWIEMAFLLANQFGLPGNPTYPKACKHSNSYVVFDNLDRTHDIVVGLLSHLASTTYHLPSSTGELTLSAEAFGLPHVATALARAA